MANIKVYLDNCCYNRPFDDQRQIRVYLESQAKMYIQEKIAYGSIDLVYSYVLKFENMKNPNEEKRDYISDFLKYAKIYVSGGNSMLIKSRAAEIMKTGVKRFDAMHVACAETADADYFITTDKRLLKFISEKTEITDPITFLTKTGV